AHKIKDTQCPTPFLFLTAKDSKEDKLKGFDLGAEDYITKPFDEDEFLCRINVALRRHQEEDSPIKYPVELGAYQFDYTKQELRYKDEMTRMTEKENEILRLLVEHQNQILKRQDAVELIYGKNDYFLGRSFDVFISRLRKHLSKDPDLRIENVFKVGFILHVKN
ncbi:MAG: response regulator transcription factor, partial [Bacteroidota bacterium]